MTAIIQVKNLVVDYGQGPTVDGVTLDIEEGELFGMIGPNGAGKTTLIECIEGLRTNYTGTISILGLNPKTDRKALYQQIGVQLQETSYPEKIKVWEICKQFSAFYKNPTPYLPLLEEFQLEPLKRAYVAQLSGGERQKLSIILAMIANPRIIFLDELTTGLDPNARHTMWALIKRLREKGMTVYMTTHFMEEAEFLCDRVAIMHHGKVVALDPTSKLISNANLPYKLTLAAPTLTVEQVKQVAGVLNVEMQNEQFTIYGQDQNILTHVISYLQREEIAYHNVNVVNPTLEDVFFHITKQEVTPESSVSISEKSLLAEVS